MAQCQNKLCGNPLLGSKDKVCPYCGTRVGGRLYPFEMHLVYALALIVVLLVFSAGALVALAAEQVHQADFHLTETAISWTPIPTRLFGDRANDGFQRLDMAQATTGSASVNLPTNGLMLLAIQGNRRTYLSIRQEGLEIFAIPESVLNSVFQARLSPDGQWLAYVDVYGTARELILVDMTTNQPYVSDFAQLGNFTGVTALAWSPNSQSLVLALARNGEQSLIILNINTLINNGNIVSLANSPLDQGYISALDWAPSNQIAYLIDDSTDSTQNVQIGFIDSNRNITKLSLPDIETGIGELSSGNYHTIGNLRWSSDALTLVFSAANTTSTYICLLRMNDPLTLQVVENSGIQSSPVWLSPAELLYIGANNQPHILNFMSEGFIVSTVETLPTGLQFIDWVKQ